MCENEKRYELDCEDYAMFILAFKRDVTFDEIRNFIEGQKIVIIEFLKMAFNAKTEFDTYDFDAQHWVKCNEDELMYYISKRLFKLKNLGSDRHSTLDNWTCKVLRCGNWPDIIDKLFYSRVISSSDRIKIIFDGEWE